jgi:ubiquinone/menaquinone biosynthesis C-methylase UbiE
MDVFDRRLFRDSRAWVCGRAGGDTLEVAVGTGLNLPHYPPGARLSGVDFSPAMLAVARDRAGALGRDVDLRVGDAQRLPYPDGRFDTVVATFALCAIPDDARAVAEMVRVLRPGGLLLLADHVVSTAWYARAVQRLVEVGSIRSGGEHFRRRPLRHVEAAGLTVEARERFTLGIVERLAARKPA